MADLLVQIRLARVNNLPEDVVINTFAFKTALPAASQTDYDAIIAALNNFYNAADAGFQTIASFISPVIQVGLLKHQIRIYTINHLGADGPPVIDTPFSLGNVAGGIPLPSEVAVAGSFSSTGPGAAARRRGRVYIGPLLESSLSISFPDSDTRPSAAAQNAILKGMTRLVADSATQWSVYSRANAALYPVTKCQVDNAFDSQRRRGSKPTAKIVTGS